MSEARTAILARVRRALDRDPTDPAPKHDIDARIASRARGPIPARAKPDQDRLVASFVTMAQEMAATVHQVSGPADVPGAVAAYLAAQNLPAVLRIAPDPSITGLPWNTRPALTISQGPARDEDAVSVTPALAGVAETGTLLVTSGPYDPSTLNMLPETHIVVLHAAAIVGSYEEAWDRLRALGTMPRTALFITGPSRTGDIEQKIQMGAHGPRRLHIVLMTETTELGPGR